MPPQDPGRFSPVPPTPPPLCPTNARLLASDLRNNPWALRDSNPRLPPCKAEPDERCANSRHPLCGAQPPRAKSRSFVLNTEAWRTDPFPPRIATVDLSPSTTVASAPGHGPDQGEAIEPRPIGTNRAVPCEVLAARSGAGGSHRRATRAVDRKARAGQHGGSRSGNLCGWRNTERVAAATMSDTSWRRWR
jgi:hypothetical protein